MPTILGSRSAILDARALPARIEPAKDQEIP